MLISALAWDFPNDPLCWAPRFNIFYHWNDHSLNYVCMCISTAVLMTFVYHLFVYSVRSRMQYTDRCCHRHELNTKLLFRYVRRSAPVWTLLYAQIWIRSSRPKSTFLERYVVRAESSSLLWITPVIPLGHILLISPSHAHKKNSRSQKSKSRDEREHSAWYTWQLKSLGGYMHLVCNNSLPGMYMSQNCSFKSFQSKICRICRNGGQGLFVSNVLKLTIMVRSVTFLNIFYSNQWTNHKF